MYSYLQADARKTYIDYGYYTEYSKLGYPSKGHSIQFISDITKSELAANSEINPFPDQKDFLNINHLKKFINF